MPESKVAARATSVVQTIDVEPRADDRLRREVNQDRAEQRERDADAAENEIFPGGFQRLVRAINADHQHGRQRCEFDRHPHQADIVGDEREVHARTSASDTSRDKNADWIASAGRSSVRARCSSR